MPDKVSIFFGCMIISSMHGLGISMLYDYGPAAGDLEAPRNDDGFVGPTDIPVSLHYFSNVFDSVFVNTNGAISFRNGVSQFTPDPFPLRDSSVLIAVFWADVDTRHGGNLYYRSTNDATLLARLTSDLQSYFGDIGDFQAQWAFVVTWKNVTYFGGSPATSTNTFQAALVADDMSTFTIFTYDAITWTTGTASGGNRSTGLGGIPAQVGFNAGDGQNYAAVPESRTDRIVNISSTSNVGVPGKYAYKLDDGVSQPCCPEVIECPAQPAPENGAVDYPTGRNLDDELVYSCNTGFVLEGASTRKCQSNGQWTSTAATCTEILCDNLPAPANGQVTHNGSVDGKTKFGEKAIFSCDQFYALQGSATLTCGGDTAVGIFDGQPPTCIHYKDIQYECTNNNPCNPLRVPNLYYYRHTEADKFIHCGAGGICHEKICPPPLLWSNKSLVCVWKWQLDSQ